MPEAPKRAVTAIPTPEELGVGQPKKAPAAPVDWSAPQRRLQKRGVVSFRPQRLAQGKHRFSCWLAASRGGQEIQAEGTSEAEAVNAALARLERLVVAR